MIVFRNFMIMILLAMWLYVSVQTGFDLYTFCMSGFACLMSSIAIYCLPHTEQEFDEIEDAFSILADFALAILKRD